MLLPLLIINKVAVTHFPKLYLTSSQYLAILHSFNAFFMAYGKIPSLEPLAVAEWGLWLQYSALFTFSYVTDGNCKCGVLLSHCLFHIKKESPAGMPTVACHPITLKIYNFIECELPIEMWHMIFTGLKEMGATNAQLASWQWICRRAEKGIQCLPWGCIDAAGGHWEYSSETIDSIGWKLQFVPWHSFHLILQYQWLLQILRQLYIHCLSQLQTSSKFWTPVLIKFQTSLHFELLTLLHLQAWTAYFDPSKITRIFFISIWNFCTYRTALQRKRPLQIMYPS